MSEAAPDPEAGRLLFAAARDFIWASASPESLPPVGAPAFAFAGCSTVGK